MARIKRQKIRRVRVFRRRRQNRSIRNPDVNQLNNTLTTSRQNDRGIADKQLVMLNYVDSRHLSGGVATLNYHQFNLNSLFDPDRTGAGHQPLSYDQWQAFYNRYRVYKVDYEVSFVANSTSNVPCAVWLQASNDTSVPSTLLNYLEQSTSSNFKVVNSTVPSARFKGTISLPQLIGQTSQQYKSNENSQAVVTSSPTEFCILNVIVASMDQTAVPDVYFTIRLTFHAELFDKYDLAQS